MSNIIIYDQNDLLMNNYQPDYESIFEAVGRIAGRQSLHQSSCVIVYQLSNKFYDDMNINIIKYRYDMIELRGVLNDFKEYYYYNRGISSYLNKNVFVKTEVLTSYLRKIIGDLILKKDEELKMMYRFQMMEKAEEWFKVWKIK